MMRIRILILAIAVILQTAFGFAHCQIPCGIYDDAMRFKMIAEHITTVEKSMKTIIALEKTAGENSNQITRWVGNKELHAGLIQDIAADYFLAQRIKRPKVDDQAEYSAYRKKLELLHSLIVYAMKTKQTTDLEIIEVLRNTLTEFQQLYLK